MNEEKPVHIYKITCRVNGKMYVGITNQGVQRRWRGHVRDALTNRFETMIAKAIRKHGEEAFLVEAIGIVATRDEASAMEIDLIATLKTLHPSGYNLTEGGDHAATRAGRTTSAETKAKMSAAAKGKKKSPEHIEKVRAFLFTRKQTPEHREIIRLVGLANKGKKRTERDRLAGQLRRRMEALNASAGQYGLKGIYPYGRGWASHVTVDQKRRYLGTFDTAEQAHAAYLAATHKAIEDLERRLAVMTANEHQKTLPSGNETLSFSP